MIKRKIKSLLKFIFKIKNNVISHIKIYFLEDNVILGKNVSLGKNVIIKTTDDGKIVIADNVCIEDNCLIYSQHKKISIGEEAFIGSGTKIVAMDDLTIGKKCLIAEYVVIRDQNHNIEKIKNISEQGMIVEPILISDDVWLGSHVTVTAGCTIAKGVVVGANSVVTKNLEAYSVYGGTPAKIIKKRV